MMRRRTRERDLQEELESHLRLAVEDRMRAGESPQVAAARARRDLGSPARIQEDARDVWGWIWLESLLQDCRYAVRTLARTPVFTIAAIAALGLGIGANTAMFSVVDAVLLKPLHVPHPERVAVFSTGVPDGQSASPVKFNLWRKQTELFEDVTVWNSNGVVSVIGGDRPSIARVARATASFFRLFGVAVQLGRPYTDAEDRPGGEQVAVLSHRFWMAHFAGDPGTIGRTIRISGIPYRITGVIVAGWVPDVGSLPDIYVPSQIDPNSRDVGDGMQLAARLRPGVSIDVARQRLKPIGDELRREFPAALDPKEQFGAIFLEDAWFGDWRSPALIFQGAVGLVLLIACANVANLLLARGAARRRELAFRSWLGASRRRLVRQLVTESCLLAASGSVVGLVIGTLGIRAILAANPEITDFLAQRLSGVGPDWRVIAFTAALAVITTLLFGLFPALQSSGNGGSGRRQTRTRALLSISEVGMAVVLLIGAALLLRSFAILRGVAPGFETHNVISMQMPLSDKRFLKTQAVAELTHAGISAASVVPGVAGVAATICLPLECTIDLPFIVAGRALNGTSHGEVFWSPVSERYFQTFRIPVIRGRGITERDSAAALPVVVINEAMAREYWKSGDPLSDRILLGKGLGERYADPWRQVVGIVGDIRANGLDESPKPSVYIPQAQLGDAFNAALTEMAPIAWVIRTSVAPQSVIGPVEKALAAASNGLPIAKVRPMSELTARSIADYNFATMLLSIFAASALILAGIGIYGVMAYSVAQRSREIGIQMALGADGGRVWQGVLWEGARLAGIGAAIGVAAAFGMSRLLVSELYGVRPWDPIAFTIAPAVLCAIAMVAVWIPAQRASRIDPMQAIRHD